MFYFDLGDLIMRFENLSYDNKIKFLQRMHRKLNKYLFNGELSEVFIDISNINKNYDENEKAFAIYHSRGYFQARDLYDKSVILLSLEALEKIEKYKTQDKQKEFIAYLIGHEMIHQYCDENGIDDWNHSKEWQIEAHKRGILDTYDDEGKSTKLEYSVILSFLVMDMRIR